MSSSSDRIQSLVIFNEIKPDYSLSDDIECRFYVDPSLDTGLDKIGLYRIGWTHKQDFIAIKDVHNCTTDEFDERRLLFTANQLPEDMVKEDIEYQFCYFHPFGHKKTYQLCGRSESFRFKSGQQHVSPETRRHASPSAPEMSIHYPILELENLDINQTNPKRVYDINDVLFDDFLNKEDDIYRNSTPKVSRRSIAYELEVKDRELTELKERFAQQNRIKDLEIERLKTSVRLTEEKVSSLEFELKTKVENEDRIEVLRNELLDSIKVIETKNTSLEEQLYIRETDLKQLKRQCLSKERIIDDLRQRLTESQSELDVFHTRSLDSTDLDDNRQDIRQENRQLKDKLQEVMQMSEKIKENNDRLIREKRLLDKIKVKTNSEIEELRQNCSQLSLKSEKAEQERTHSLLKLRSKEVQLKKYAEIIGEAEGQANQSVDQLLAESRRALNSSITVFANEMTEELKEFCINQTKDALKKYSDIKSIADSVVYAMDDRFGNCWNCFIGQDFAHNSLLHVFGTYFSFAINDLKIIIYKTNDMPDSCQVIRWAKESSEVDILFKTEYTDNGFEDLVVSTVLESLNEDFVDFTELSSHLTKVFNSKYGSKYGFNWLAICGESDRFDSNLLLFSKKYKFIELEINLLKVIVIQFDEKIIETKNTLFLNKNKKF